MLPIIGGETVQVCARCNNYGYYQVGVEKRKETVQMFCSCPVGQALKGIAIEWRAGDMKLMAEAVLEKLKEVKDSLHEPSRAGKLLEETIKELKDTIKKCEGITKK